MSRKNILAILIIAIFIVLAVISYKKEDSKKNIQSYNTIVVTKELSPQEFDKVKQEFFQLVDTHDPKFALDELREKIKTDNSLLRSCHALVHEIGHHAYEKYKDFGQAMKYQDEICNSGYLHGVIESHFSNSPDVFVAMKNVCDPYPVGKYLSWECYHGVGHGLMYYTGDDLPKSLELCDKYKNTFEKGSCSNGAFMENFNSDQVFHQSEFLKESDPFYPCALQTNEHKNDCYLYAPTYYLSLHNDDYNSALKWCETAPNEYKEICAEGVGSQAMKENINTPNAIEEICMIGLPNQITPCITGMVNLYINHFGSLDPAKELCEKLKPLNRNACYASIQTSSHLF